MKALLKCVGIESYYTEIGNGIRQIRYKDFPSFYQTNHVILTVPSGKDTTFLECTSQNYPVGYIGSSNADRYALMAAPAGGHLIRTPVYNHESNMRTTHIHIHLMPDGNGTADILTDYAGKYYETYSGFAQSNKKEQEDELLELHGGLDYKVDSFTYNYVFASNPAFLLREYLSFRKYASASGPRLFIPLNVIRRYEPKLSLSRPRLTDIRVITGFTERDSLSIDIPPGYIIENMPKAVSVENIFGKLKTEIEVRNEKIFIVNDFTLYKSDQPRTAYQELASLLEKAFKSTQSKIVLKKVSP